MKINALKLIPLALCMVMLAACSSDPAPKLTLTLPTRTPPEMVKQISAAAPALEKNLPGLFKYQKSMTLKRLDANTYSPEAGAGLPGEMPVTWLEFVVADDGGTIPKEYRAQGHHIRIGIADVALILQKAQAKSVFLDREFPPGGGDLIIQF